MFNVITYLHKTHIFIILSYVIIIRLSVNIFFFKNLIYNNISLIHSKNINKSRIKCITHYISENMFLVKNINH